MHQSNRLFRLAIAIAAVALTACGDSTSPKIDVTGTWTLRSVDGISVDAAPPSNVDIYFRIHEQLKLQAGGSYEDVVHAEQIDVPTGDVLDAVTDTVNGNWTFTGSTLHLLHDGVNETGGLVGDTLKVGTFAFTR